MLFRSAVDYGADAVYIGGAKFGARHAAGNSAEQIARVAEYAHRYAQSYISRLEKRIILRLRREIVKMS